MVQVEFKLFKLPFSPSESGITDLNLHDDLEVGYGGTVTVTPVTVGCCGRLGSGLRCKFRVHD